MPSSTLARRTPRPHTPQARVCTARQTETTELPTFQTTTKWVMQPIGLSHRPRGSPHDAESISPVTGSTVPPNRKPRRKNDWNLMKQVHDSKKGIDPSVWTKPRMVFLVHAILFLLFALFLYLVVKGIANLLSIPNDLSSPWLMRPNLVRLRKSILSDYVETIILQRQTASVDRPIVIGQHKLAEGAFHMKSEASTDFLAEASLLDNGGLKMSILQEDGFARKIHDDSWLGEGHGSDKNKKKDYTVDQYHAYDDDYLRSPYVAYDDDKIKDIKRCRRVSWHRYQFPNCNAFHEMDLKVDIPVHLNDGAYLGVFIYLHKFLGREQKLIWKHIQFGDEFDFAYDNYEFVRMDALISERLTFSSRIVDMYGHCGLSILAEWLPGGDLESMAVPTSGFIKQEDLHDEMDVNPQNNLTAIEKLVIAKEMAEALAVLHGFSEGIIIHDDIQPTQFLHDERGHIKLNDFNRGEVMLYNEEEQQWCQYRNGIGSGNLRAPEEYMDKPLNEKIDIYSFGNVVYTLLTGLWPLYGIEDEGEFAKKLIKGEKPYVDPRYKTRSFAEGKLVEVLEKCLAFNPGDRPTIFAILEMLTTSIEKWNASHHE